jgi:hypothetical protein
MPHMVEMALDKVGFAGQRLELQEPVESEDMR